MEGALFVLAFVLVGWALVILAAVVIVEWCENKKYPVQYMTYSQTYPQVNPTSPSTTTPPEPLEETWSPEKIEAWRVISLNSKSEPNKHPVGTELHAKCSDIPIHAGYGSNPCEEPPGESCTSGFGDGCGYYACKTREQAVSYLNIGLFFPTAGIATHAIARVLLSGKVIEHEEGYRAEILEVVSFETPPEKKPLPEKKPFVPPGSTIPSWIGQGIISATTGRIMTVGFNTPTEGDD